MEPMLATAWEKRPLQFPLYASPKIDGVRAWMPEDRILSRKMKDFPNPEIAEKFGGSEFEGLDGEFTIGDPTAPDVFRRTSSIVMSKDKSTDGLVLRLFDDIRGGHALPFSERLASLSARAASLPNVELVEQVLVHTEEELREHEERWLSQGYEGAMVRTVSSPYKFGRSTEKEGFLLKVKRFADCEAEIIGTEEQMHNENEATTDERGFTKRSSHQENKRGAGTLGALVVRAINGPFQGVEFNVGTGFDAATRLELWGLREELPGKVVKVKYFPTGSKGKPRFPTFVGFRVVEVDG